MARSVQKTRRNTRHDSAFIAPNPKTKVARRRSSSPEASSTSSTSNEGAQHHRTLRPRLSTTTSPRKDGVQPSATTAGRKRSSGISQATQPRTGSKRSKKDLLVSIYSEEPTRGPMTRSQRHKLNQVTPSPGQTTARGTSSAFTFTKSRVFDGTPKGVVDLYPSKDSTELKRFCTSFSCSCVEDACSSKALSASYIQTYGKEYCQYMKDKETPIVPEAASIGTTTTRHTSRPATGRNINLFENDGSPDEYSSPDSSHETPARRRVWGSLDTSGLSPIKAVESSRFLDYQPDLTPKMRAILMDWIIELSEHFNFGHSTLHLACTLIDHVLSCGPLSFDEDDDDEDSGNDVESKTNCFLISRDRFQLLGATCTWLACKMEEQKPPQVSQIAYVSDNIYSVEQIKRMERRVCNALGFAMARQTPYLFIHEFLRASQECSNPGCEAPESFHFMVLYLLELGRLTYVSVTKKPSLLAAAVVYLARVTFHMEPWSKTMEYYTGYKADDLMDIVLAVHSHQVAAEESSLKSCFAKYKHKKYHRVALKTSPRVEDLGF